MMTKSSNSFSDRTFTESSNNFADMTFTETVNNLTKKNFTNSTSGWSGDNVTGDYFSQYDDYEGNYFGQGSFGGIRHFNK